MTRIGELEPRAPRDRSGEKSTALLERYTRSEKALVAALTEMHVQGVSTRKIKAITEEFCGHGCTARSISQINKALDAALTTFAGRRLTEPYPYLILDTRYEKVRATGVIESRDVQIAIGINRNGRQQVLTTTACRNRAGSMTGGAFRKPIGILAAWIGKWQGRYPKLGDWVENNIGQRLSFYRLPRPHHKHLAHQHA